MTESLDLDKLAMILFKGGFDSLFTTNSGYTTIDGDVTISNGWIGLERIICDKLTIGGSDSPIMASLIVLKKKILASENPHYTTLYSIRQLLVFDKQREDFLLHITEMKKSFVHFLFQGIEGRKIM